MCGKQCCRKISLGVMKTLISFAAVKYTGCVRDRQHSSAPRGDVSPMSLASSEARRVPRLWTVQGKVCFISGVEGVQEHRVQVYDFQFIVVVFEEDYFLLKQAVGEEYGGVRHNESVGDAEFDPAVINSNMFMGIYHLSVTLKKSLTADREEDVSCDAKGGLKLEVNAKLSQAALRAKRTMT